MLTRLSIKNFALIHRMDIHWSKNMNVITGETGAGKSILLGALGLLMGNRADSKALWNEEEKCVSEGEFDIKAYKLKKLFDELDIDYFDATTIRREILPGGKSRAFINDTPVTLDVLKQVSAQLMDIHSQHETLLLQNKKYQLYIVDVYADLLDLRSDVEKKWLAYTNAKKEWEDAQADVARLKSEYDFIHYQWKELSEANLQEDELEKQERELLMLENVEKIQENLQGALLQLSDSEFSLTHGIAHVKQYLTALTKISPAYTELAARVDSLKAEMQDVYETLQDFSEKTEFNPERLQEISQRVSLLNQLLQKHKKKTIRELLDLQADWESSLTKTQQSDAHLHALQQTMNEHEKSLRSAAEKLSAARQKNFEPFTNEWKKLLDELGMPNGVLTIQHATAELSATGVDTIDFLFSANKGITPQPIGNVASGGEFARVMLGLKYILAKKKAMPTLVLDEIDTGVSGEIAIRMSHLMRDMATRHQLLVITHLPQIASAGQAHFLVAKNHEGTRTYSEIKNLSNDERVQEIAMMIGGKNPSAIALSNAAELLRG